MEVLSNWNTLFFLPEINENGQDNSQPQFTVRPISPIGILTLTFDPKTILAIQNTLFGTIIAYDV